MMRTGAMLPTVVLMTLTLWTCASLAQNAPASWRTPPDPQVLYRAYPVDALKTRAGGKVRLGCTLGLDSHLTACTVVEENPKGAGFGDAALGLASSFALNPPLKDGLPIADSQVFIPITFEPPHPVIKPSWKRMPSISEMGKYYPIAALRSGQSGKVILSCLVGDSGALGACHVLSEEPTGLGFGGAALALTPSFLMSPLTVEGVPVGGGEVRIPIIFGAMGGPGTGPPMVLQGPKLYRAVSWSSLPSLEDLRQAYVNEPTNKGVNAVVAMECMIGLEGRLHDCSTLNAAGGERLIGAAKLLTRNFQATVDPKTGPKRDDLVTLAIHFWPGLVDGPAPELRAPLQAYEMSMLKGVDTAQLLLPDAALKAGVKSASATVSCRISSAGSPEACKVEKEDIAGVGVGEAVVTVLSKLRLSNWNSQGESIVGRVLETSLVLHAPPKTTTGDP